MTMRYKRGFTLIELLVVVAIIALLISILLPSIESARAQARAVVCSTKLHDIYTAQNNYAAQFSDWIPGSPGTTGGHLIYTGYGPYDFDIPGVPVQNWDWQSPLAHYGLGIESADIKLSPLLTVDPKTEQFVGSNAEAANQFLKREYRNGYEVPEII